MTTTTRHPIAPTSLRDRTELRLPRFEAPPVPTFSARSLRPASSAIAQSPVDDASPAPPSPTIDATSTVRDAPAAVRFPAPARTPAGVPAPVDVPPIVTPGVTRRELSAAAPARPAPVHAAHSPHQVTAEPAALARAARVRVDATFGLVVGITIAIILAAAALAAVGAMHGDPPGMH